MITIRKSHDRGHANFGWLDSYHTFSFGEYYDPAHMHCRSLRVINEDVVAPESGFPTHPHDNMEIVTYVISGTLTHTDSMGHRTDIPAGDVQLMRAGTGVTHSEWNYSKIEPVHLLQIWILPNQHGLTPAYQQITVSDESKQNTLRRLEIDIQQDVQIYASKLDKDAELQVDCPSGRTLWVQLISGQIRLDDDQVLGAGDAAKVKDQPSLAILGQGEKSEFLVFDLR